MSTIVDPREVEKPFLKRWLRMTLELFMRSPVRFGIVIAILGWLDTSAQNLAQGHSIEKAWIDRLGFLMLPLLWVVMSALARGADDPRRTREAMAGLARTQVWRSALTVGAMLAAMNWGVVWVLHGFRDLLIPPKPGSYLQQPGQFLESIAANVFIVVVSVGLCYFPLLVLSTQGTPGYNRHLSKKADAMNGEWVIYIFVSALALGAAEFASVVPAYGMTTAAFLVFMGTLNYVAYRDIFERQSGNLPKAVAATHVVASAAVTR